MSGRIVVEPFEHGLWALRSDYFSPLMRECAKQIPGMKWHGLSRSWVGYPDAVDASCHLLREKNLRWHGPQDLLEVIRAKQPTDFTASYEKSRYYQKDGIDFLIQHAPTGALLADVPRIGKTHQSLRAAEAIDRRTLVICPAHVVGVWAWSNAEAKRPCEVEKWWPAAYAKGVKTFEGVRPKPEDLKELLSFKEAGGLVVVIHYDIVYAWAQALIDCFDFGTLVIDEIHACMTETSRRSQFISKLALHAKRTIGLSGTPLTNRTRDLFSTCNILSPSRGEGLPPRFGESFYPFGIRYCEGKQITVGRGETMKTVYDFNGSSNREELHRRLQFFMLRRTKSEVAEQLPKVTREVIELQIPKKFAVPLLPSLQTPKAARRALDLAADGALPQVINILEEDFREDIKQVVFCHRRSIAEFIHSRLATKKIPTELIHGHVPKRKREALIQAARDAQAGHALVVTIDATSTGIDLSYASTATYVELPWELVDLIQSMERLYNYEQFSPISIRFLIASGTTSELILDRLLSKLSLFEEVVGSIGDSTLRTDLLGQKTGEDALADLCREMLADIEKKKERKVLTKVARTGKTAKP